MNQNENIIKIYDECASIYEVKFMNQEKYSESLDLFISSVSSTDANILDVACGPGNLSKFLLNRNPQFEILGIDLSEKMLSLARKNNPSASYVQKDGRNVHELEQKFDGIVCGFLLPYLNKNETIEFIKNLSIVMNDESVLFLSAVIGEYRNEGIKTSSSDGQYSMNLYHHEEEYLMNSLHENHLKIICKKKQELTPEKKDTKELILLAKKVQNN